MEIATTKKHYSITETAEILGVSRNTLHRWINTGQIERFYIMKNPYIKAEEVERVKKELNQ